MYAFIKYRKKDMIMVTIKSIKEQYQIKDTCLKERLELILPQVMKDNNIDMWISASKEYNEDPLFHAITPASYPTARRISLFAFVKDGDTIHRFSLCMPSVELAPYYTSYWTDFNHEDQMACLNRLCKEFDPQTIALNASCNFAFSDGLSQGLYEMITGKMEPQYVNRIVRNDLLAIKLMELRTPTELKLHPEVMDVAFSVIEEAFSAKSITPGVTTCEDLQWLMMQRVKDLGLDYWFEPTVDLQRAGLDDPRYFGVIEKGDLLHCDFGIKYLNICTDTQRLAYVAKDGEDAIPQELLAGMKINDRFQDIVALNMAEGKSGNDVLRDSLKQGSDEGIEAVLYSHPCNFYGHGPGPTIGLWNNQTVIPISGDVKMSYDTTYALELNTKAQAFGQDYYFYTEETIAFTRDGLVYLHPGRKNIYLIK